MMLSCALDFAKTVGLRFTGDLHPLCATDLLRNADPPPDEDGEDEDEL